MLKCSGRHYSGRVGRRADGFSDMILRAVMEPVLFEVIDSLPLGALALDVGCGAGRVIAYLTLQENPCIDPDCTSGRTILLGESGFQPREAFGCEKQGVIPYRFWP
jgi:hypothetical protein